MIALSPPTAVPGEHPSGLIGLIPDLLSSYMFILNADAEILDLNLAARRLIGADAGEVLHHRSGEVLRCIHSMEVPGGCGYADACAGCPLRSSITGLLAGQARVRKHVRMFLKRGDSMKLFLGVVTAIRMDQPGMDFRALLIIDNVDDLLELRDVLPVCMRCGKLGAGHGEWIDPTSYLERAYEVRLSHGYCPVCLKVETEGLKSAR